jgi:elongation factor G
MRRMAAPKPVLSIVVEPRTIADRERLGRGLERLRREFNVEASVGSPQVVYKEMTTRPSDGEGRYVRQTGGRGQYGHAKVRLYPGKPGSGYVFENGIVDGSIPEAYVAPISDGIREGLARGVLAGCPIDDVKVELHGGSFHDVDSSEATFKTAGVMALQSLEERGDMQVLSTHVPLSQMLGYVADLRARTEGRATCSMHLDRYEQVRGGPDGDDRTSPVSAPLRPNPKANQSAVELPEPDDF